jgi:hypothetical protein
MFSFEAELQEPFFSRANRGRSFFQKPFFRKFVVAPPPEVLGDERTN